MTFDSELAALADAGLLRPIGNTVYLMPPYILDDAEIEQLCRVVGEALDTALEA
jgi:adenosylmethionine---8-amino-7-oxononanoate aminotransferase